MSERRPRLPLVNLLTAKTLNLAISCLSWVLSPSPHLSTRPWTLFAFSPRFPSPVSLSCLPLLIPLTQAVPFVSSLPPPQTPGSRRLMPSVV